MKKKIFLKEHFHHFLGPFSFIYYYYFKSEIVQHVGGDECAESHAHAKETREHVKPSQSSADDPTANIPEI